jgi:hypothetical protein
MARGGTMTLAAWLAAVWQGRADELAGLTRAQRRLRDRAIGRTMTPAVRDDDAAALRAWVEQVEGGRRLERARSTLAGATAGVVIIAALLGALVASGVLAYTGEAPVNVLTLIGVLVVLPGMVLLASVVLVSIGAPPAVVGLGGVVVRWVAQRVERFADPGAPPRDRDDALTLPTPTRAHGAVLRWAGFVTGQWAGVAFAVGALLALLGHIVFTDLAFGWNTTLDLSPASFAAVVQVVAWPWAWAWPAASPGLALVEATQVFRARPGDLAAVAEDARRWWPFVVMCVATYGLLPRVAALIIGAWRQHSAIAEAVAKDVDFRSALERLRLASVDTGATTHDAPAARDDARALPVTTATPPTAVEVRWAGAPGHADDALHAGGDRTLDDDHATFGVLRRQITARPGAAIRLCVKAWEPPLLEVVDFIKALRNAVGHDTAIEVAAYRLAGGGEDGVRVWARKLATLRDERLTLRDAGEVTPETNAAGKGGDA